MWCVSLYRPRVPLIVNCTSHTRHAFYYVFQCYDVYLGGWGDRTTHLSSSVCSYSLLSLSVMARTSSVRRTVLFKVIADDRIVQNCTDKFVSSLDSFLTTPAVFCHLSSSFEINARDAVFKRTDCITSSEGRKTKNKYLRLSYSDTCTPINVWH